MKSPDWLRYKNAMINQKKVDDSYFQYVFALTQRYEEIKNNGKLVSNIKTFIDVYNWNGIMVYNI